MSSPSSAPEENGATEPQTQSPENGDGGLFGSGSEGEDSDVQRRSPKRRRLEDSELDSGDDEGRRDREDNDEVESEEDFPEKTAVIADVSVAKYPGPQPSDDELYLLGFPSNIILNPKAFTLESFEPPVVQSGQSSTRHSALSTSNNTIRWRQSPSNPAVNQSNARINRWSDGSLTLQIASNPSEQIELTAQTRAPPQIHPVIPTPTSLRPRPGDKVPNSQSNNWHIYLACPHEGAGMIRNSGHITAQLSVQSTDQMDDAVMKLQQSLAASGRGNRAGGDKGPQLINVDEDPEKARRQAELAEKEKAKMQRRYQNQIDRDYNRNGNVLKRSGLRPGGLGGGLTVGALEGDDDLGAAKRSRGSTNPKKPRRRNDEYSDEDDFRGRRRTKEDEYDENDGFLVDSDEEPEVAESSEEEDDADDDMDAEGEEDDEAVDQAAKPESKAEDAAAAVGRKRGRRVLDDDDE